MAAYCHTARDLSSPGHPGQFMLAYLSGSRGPLAFCGLERTFVAAGARGGFRPMRCERPSDPIDSDYAPGP
jgi:hypothetical protein